MLVGHSLRMYGFPFRHVKSNGPLLIGISGIWVVVACFLAIFFVAISKCPKPALLCERPTFCLEDRKELKIIAYFSFLTGGWARTNS